jgi:hypothetical protein
MAYERRSFAGGGANTTIPAGCDGSTLSITIADATGWPTGSGGDFYAVIDLGEATEEKVLVDTRSGTALTIAASGRGVDGTSGVVHAAGATIALCLTALDLDEANAHVSGNHDPAHDAATISFTSGGALAATDVGAAIDEVEALIPATTPNIAVGTYVGTGGAREIALSFTPALVFVINETVSSTDFFAWLSPITTAGTRGAAFRTAAAPSSDLEVQAQTTAIPVTSGFTANGVNVSGHTYRYVAFGVNA